MYKIIGADQKEYGPITGEQLQQWALEGRVNGQTIVWSDASNNWKPLSTYPELSGITSTAPAVIPPLSGVPPFGDPNAGHASALQKVSGPALGLLITAVFGVLGSVLGMILSMVGFRPDKMPTGNPEIDKFVAQLSSGMGVANVASLVLGLVASGFILYGALKLKKLESPNLCIAACIIAMIPCFTGCCCVIGLPVGIWGLMVMNKSDVKPYFQ